MEGTSMSGILLVNRANNADSVNKEVMAMQQTGHIGEDEAIGLLERSQVSNLKTKALIQNKMKSLLLLFMEDLGNISLSH